MRKKVFLFSFWNFSIVYLKGLLLMIILLCR